MGLLDKLTKKKEVIKALDKKSAESSVEEKNDDIIVSDATDTKNVKKKAVKKNTTIHSNAYKILVRPIISEKALSGESEGVYTFEVSLDSTKVGIKKAVQTVYGVLPKKVHIMNMDGKRVRFGRVLGRRKDWKKAMIFLPKGKTINIHEGV